MSAKSTNLAVLFADISGSTRLYDTLGDAIACERVNRCLETLKSISTSGHGKVIKTIGDEVMCTFPTAGDAASASCQMHETMENEVIEDDNTEAPLQIRIGMHYGPTLIEGEDVYGDAVNVAARMATQAKGGQIITTQQTLDRLPPILQASSRFVDQTSIKGKKDEINIFELIWQHEDINGVVTDAVFISNKPAKKTMLELNYRGQEIEMDKLRQSVELGRSKSCDMTIHEKLVSRQHVRIELRREKYFIIDQSTNGTHVLLDDGGNLFLRREEMCLSGSGKISFGRSFSENPMEVVSFNLKK